MDKQHAKFILQSYRPDGADSADPDFQEALQLAAEDRELGQWLAQERSHDAIFVEALEQVNIPDTLKDEILLMLEHGGAEADMSSELDALFAGAIAQQTPPPGLRDQIISAMEVEKKALDSDKQAEIVKFPSRWLNVAAVAAVALLTFTVIYSSVGSKSGKDQQGPIAKVPAVQSEANMLAMKTGMILNASYELEKPADSITVVNTWLKEEGMPVAKSVPEALVSYDVSGGKKIAFENGIEGSLIFFKGDNAEDYYLAVIDLKSVKDADAIGGLSEVGLKSCYDCPLTKFSIAKWKDESEAYFLMTKSDEKKMLELF